MKDKYEYKLNFTENYLKSSNYKALEVGLQRILDDMYRQSLLKHRPVVEVTLTNGVVDTSIDIEVGYLDY